jgi:hypothetical protein
LSGTDLSDISDTKTNQFTMLVEEVTFCSLINTKHINTVWEERKIVKFVCSNAAGVMDVCLWEVLLSGINICDELITGAEASYLLWCVLVCDLET